MTNIWYSSFVLYAGDTMMIAALVGGIAALIATTIRNTHRFVILDIDQHQIRKFTYFQIAWLASALILFKFIVLEGGPHFNHLILTGNHGSVQFSTAGELVAFALMALGLYRWGRWLTRHLRLTARAD